ncbi:hypothetical protein Vafri_4016 [Volvox africanus]|uniref:C2H2-type domain-containing protein n=2 Tax=Volvox africanus TaxID=51714 RepID=A0A8J4AVE2_9CHLO|nr:hypothetical protein Vafri_4016 [Volvox africanus]
MSTGQGGGHLDQSFFRIATECAGVLKDFCRGQRAKAKKALQRLAQEHPNSFLPHRYLARLLYHESARVEADQQVSSGTLPSHRRLALLHSALLEAKQASELAPGSLSSAALRATLLVNLLVEESALQGGLAIPQEQPPHSDERVASDACSELTGSPAGHGSGDVAWFQLQPEARCEAIKREFREAIAHCVRTLECNAPLLVEPVISISDAHARTCDPCCLRVQDSIVEWVKQDNWQRIVAEKRSVLACMHQVLESCHTLLDSTHIPVDGIVRLLQHILRPHQQDLQLWASQLLLSKGSVDDLQHKFETQAAVTELLRMLRPGRPNEELAGSISTPQPGLLQPPQGKAQLSPAVIQMYAPTNAAQQQQQQQQQQLTANNNAGQAASAPLDAIMGGRAVAGPVASQPLPPPPQQELAACLSAEQEWDDVREGGGVPSAGAGTTGAGGGAGSRRVGGKGKNKAKGNDAARGARKERSRYERYMDVETFWRTTPPEQRRELLKVPMAALLKGVRREHGNDAVDELIEGLVLLREQGNRAACYWLCPVCEQKFHSSRDFLGHVEMVHEGLAVQDNKYVCCYKCQQDVVGMYYTSTRTPGYNLCFRCYSADAASVSTPEAFEKVFMRHSAGRPWSSHSDFMSTRGSFSSLSERSHRHHHQQQQQQQQQALGTQKLHQPGGSTGTGGAGHVHSATCRHHPHCPHHSHGQSHGQQQYGLESSSAQPPLKLGEASDEWLAPFPEASLSAPLMVPDPRAGLPGTSGAATLPPPHAPGMRSRGKRSSGGSEVSSDSILGQSLHSRSLSEPANHGLQAGDQGQGAGGSGITVIDDGADGGGTGNSTGTWRSWWPTRLMQGWAGKAQQQQQLSGQQQQGPGQQQQQQLQTVGSGLSGASRENSRQGAVQPIFDHGGPPGVPRLGAKVRSSPDGAGDSGSAEDEDGAKPLPQAAGGTPARAGYVAGAAELAGIDGFGRMNGMVTELLTRLREIYLTDRDLGDTTLGYITQFVYRKLGVGAAADDLHLASCPPGPRTVLLEFLAQPSIVFQRPQALAMVLSLLPLVDLQIVAAYAVRQHENAVSGMEAAARDIAAGSDGDADGRPEEEEDDCDGAGAGGGGSGSEQEYQLGLAARREAARVAASETAVASQLAAPMPRARRRLRYTSRRVPAVSSAASQVSSGIQSSSVSTQLTAPSSQPQHHFPNTRPTTPPLPPHAGGGFHIGGSHALTLRRVDDDVSAEEVSEEEMESTVDGVEYALATDAEASPLRCLSTQHAVAANTMPRSQQHQLDQLRHAGGAGMHLVARPGTEGANAVLGEDDRSVEGTLDEEGDEEVSEDIVGEADEELSEEDEEDGVSLVPDEDEEEDGPCVSLFNVAGDVELGFDRLITQMWGGGAENDEAASAALDQQSAAANSVPASCAGNSNYARSRSQQQGNRGGRNHNQGRQQSPATRGLGMGNNAATVATGCTLAGVMGAAGAVGLPDDPVLAEELVGPREDEPYLLVADWWLHHLRLDGGGPVPDELRVLRWVYGNVINVQAEEFCARQRELRGGRDRDAAILDLYDEVAAVWRSLQAVTDKRSRLEALRRAARGHFAVVRRLEEAGGHASLEQATEFLDAVLSGYCQGQQGGVATAASATSAGAGTLGDGAPLGPPEQPGTPTMSEATSAPADASATGSSAAADVPASATAGADNPTVTTGAGAASSGPSGPLLYLCERAVEVVRRHPALAQEPSQRYAAALLERELSVLALVEVMVAAEAEDAARERGVAEESLKRHRAEHREAEAEYQRVQAEGPASHRKKDLLDKATKEAEHREQLRELAARLASLSDSIAADEANKTRYAEKHEEAERELAYVRDAIRQTSTRRASLLDVCATLDVPFAPPPQHQQRANLPQQRLNRAGGGLGAVQADHVSVDGPAATPSSSHAEGDVCSAALALGPPSGGGLGSAAADMEWRATRLECLMYRVLWVSEAVKMFQPQYNPRPTTHHYNLFIRATHWAKQLSEEYEESIRAYCCELERLRARLRDVAAVDLGYEIGAAALEVIRRRIEAAARAAREAASLTLLKELEEEEERRKAAITAAKDAKDAGGGAGGGTSKKTGANKKAAKASQDSRSRAQKEKERELARQAEEEARRRAEEEDKERVAAARRAREVALEAELERRRRELEELEAQREAEAIRAAQEASLREQQLREQCERDKREREQREKEQRETEQREKATAAAGLPQTQAQVQQAQLQQHVAANAAASAPALRSGIAQTVSGIAVSGARKLEGAPLQQMVQPHQQMRRQASSEHSPEKSSPPPPPPPPPPPQHQHQPKRNASHGTRARVATTAMPDRLLGNTPESLSELRVPVGMQIANGFPPGASSRGGLPTKAGAAANPASPPQSGAYGATSMGVTSGKVRQMATAHVSPPASSSSSPAAPDSAAAAAVAAATAGIVNKATQIAVAIPGGARSSPGKQCPGGVPSTPPAGGNIARRHQQQHGQASTQAMNPAGGPNGATLTTTLAAGSTGPAWSTAAQATTHTVRVPLQLSHPQQPVPQTPSPQLDAQSGQASGVPGMIQGPLSPGSEFPPLSAAVAVATAGHRQATPAPPQPAAQPPQQTAPSPPPQQLKSFAASAPMQVHQLQAQAQAQAQAHSHVKMQAPNQAQAHAQGFADAQARLMAFAQGPGAAPAAAMGAAQPPLQLHGELAMLHAEHLHVHYRQQQLNMQHHYRQQLQHQQQSLSPSPQQQSQHQLLHHHQHHHQQSATSQHQQPTLPQQQAQPAPMPLQVLQSSPGRPPVDGVTVPDFNPFAENPVFKALAMDAKAPQPASPSSAAALAAAAAPGPTPQVQQQQAPAQAPQPLPPAQTHADALLAAIQASQPGSTAPEADTHIQSIMSILDQDGQAPPAGSGQNLCVSQHGPGPGAKASPGTSASTQSGAASQTPTASSSPQRVLMPTAQPPGPVTGLYGNPYGISSAGVGPPLLPPAVDGPPGPATGIGPMAVMSSPAAAVRMQTTAQPVVLPNGASRGLGGVGGNGIASAAMGTQADALATSIAGTQPGVLAGLPASAAFVSGIWRAGGEQLGPGSPLPVSMLGLGLGLSGIGSGPNTWGNMSLSNPPAGGGATNPRASSGTITSPRQASKGGTGEWGASPAGTGSAAAGAMVAGAGRDGGLTLPDSVDTLVASLPTTLLPASLDGEPAPSPIPPPGVAAAAAASGLAPTAAPFYPASLRGKVGAVGGVGVGVNSGMIQAPQQQLVGCAGGPGGMAMGPTLPVDSSAWMNGLVPGKQGAAAAAAAAATVAAANGLVVQGQHVTQQQQLSGPGGMAALPGVLGPGGVRYMGLYNGDGVNWSHGGIMPAAGGMVSAPGIPAAVRATSSTWAPFVPPAGGMAASQQQFVQQAAQQQAQQQPQQMAGWPRGQRWRN